MINKGIWVDTTSIWRRILKEKLGYSFKRCSSRPLKLNYGNQELKKILFCIKLLKIVRRSTLLVNIDESIIFNTTKSNFYWGQKGASSNLSTIGFKGSISIVTAILSNGVSITGIRKGTITSSSFTEYMDHMLTVWARL